jgi:hypothetical protein
VTTQISGRLTIIFHWTQREEQFVSSSTNLEYKRISDFGVSIIRPSSGSTISPKRENSREYKEDITTQSSESVSVDVKYATDNWNTFGTAFVCTKEGSYMKNITYWTGDSERPEQHLCDRLSALYSKPTEWREIDVSDAQAKYITPRYVLKNADGHYWAPIAAARQWSECIVRLTIGDMGTWTPPASYNLADCNDWLLLTSSDEPLVVVGG